MTKILVADDDEIFLAAVERILTDHDYDVVAVSTPGEALAAFDQYQFDVAVLDYRLRDSRPGDQSGLDVAMKSDARVPKIIISDKAEGAEIMRAVRTSPEGLAVAVAFLAKDDIVADNNRLYEAVQDALKTRKVWRKQAREAINPELLRDFRRVSWIAAFESILHILANAAFVGIMAYAALRLHEGQHVLQMLVLIIGIVTGEIINLMLAKGKEGSLIARADQFHGELLQSARFEQLLSACESLGNPADVNSAKLEVIRSATTKWIGGSLEGKTDAVPRKVLERHDAA